MNREQKEKLIMQAQISDDELTGIAGGSGVDTTASLETTAGKAGEATRKILEVMGEKTAKKQGGFLGSRKPEQ